MHIYDTRFSLSDSIHSVYQVLGSSTSLQVTQIHSFSWLNNSPLCVWAVSFFSQSVQWLCLVRLFVSSWTAACQASLSFTVSWSLLKLMPIEFVAMQPSHPLSSPSPPAFNLSQHQGLFQWVSFLYQVAKVLELQLQHQSFQWIFRTDFLSDWLVWLPWSPRNSLESSPTPQFKSINSLVLSSLYTPTPSSIHDHWKNHSSDQTDLCWQNNVSTF